MHQYIVHHSFDLFVLFVMKKCLHDRQSAFGLDKYEVSLWIVRIMSFFCNGLLRLDA